MARGRAPHGGHGAFLDALRNRPKHAPGCSGTVAAPMSGAPDGVTAMIITAATGAVAGGRALPVVGWAIGGDPAV
jgi:hypothetical protein